MQTPPSTTLEAVLTILREELEALLPLSSVTLDNYNTQYLQQNPSSVEAALAVAKAQWVISGHRDKQGVSNVLTEALKGGEKPSLAVSSGIRPSHVCHLLTLCPFPLDHTICTHVPPRRCPSRVRFSTKVHFSCERILS